MLHFVMLRFIPTYPYKMHYVPILKITVQMREELGNLYSVIGRLETIKNINEVVSIQ